MFRLIKVLAVLFVAAFLASTRTSVAAQSTSVSKSKPNISSSVSKPRRHYLQTNGIRIHYLEWNKGGDSTVLLLHGLYDTADTWSAVAPLLARDYRVIALDRRGAGLTDKPPSGYDFQTLAMDVLSLIDRLKVQRVHLVGHSAGAGVALTAAAIEPKKINSVALVDGGFWAKRAESSNAQAAPPCTEKPIDCERKLAIERGNKDYNAELLYARVSAPTLLVMGVPPKLEAEQFARELQEAQSHVEKVAKGKLRNGKMVVIRETSHWIQRDQPTELASVIKDFLKRNAFSKSFEKFSLYLVSHYKFNCACCGNSGVGRFSVSSSKLSLSMIKLVFEDNTSLCFK